MTRDIINNTNPFSNGNIMGDFESMMQGMQDYLKNYNESLKSVPVRPDKEESLAEAARRMESLGFRNDIITEFKKDGEISCVMEKGSTYPLDESDRRQIKKLEKQGYAVYAAIRNITDMGRMTSYIIVSSCGEDWIIERENLNRGIVMAYVLNHDIPFFSEFGTVNIKRHPAGMYDRIF